MHSSKKYYHSTTSSAVATSVSGTEKPSALAVLRLSFNSYLVGCWNGRSPTFAPRRIRSPIYRMVSSS